MKHIIPILGILLAFSCVKDSNFDEPASLCSTSLEANTTIAELKALYTGTLLQIQEDLIIEGYVISSDRAGNFFNELFIQDQSVNPTEGLQIQIDLRSSYLQFPAGSRLLVKTKGLYLSQRKGRFVLGGTFTAFGTTSVGRLPALKIPEHLFLRCDAAPLLEPSKLSLEDLVSVSTPQLVQINNLEIVPEQLDSLFASPRVATERTLIDCVDRPLTLLNSGFADFQAATLPQKKGSITGVLLREDEVVYLVIRDLADIQFTEERCEDLITEFTSEELFFSELADPDNTSQGRFLELFLADTNPLDLNGWSIRRYTNANTEVSSSIDLSGIVLQGNAALVISAYPDAFTAIYGRPPDLVVSTNSAADSNGDDNLELVDPFGKVVDVFGKVGEDGSGTNHEFEDGRAMRISEISQGNPTYTFSEWIIFNDTGGAGTVNEPQNAPENYTPGTRN